MTIAISFALVIASGSRLARGQALKSSSTGLFGKSVTVYLLRFAPLSGTYRSHCVEKPTLAAKRRELPTSHGRRIEQTGAFSPSLDGCSRTNPSHAGCCLTGLVTHNVRSMLRGNPCLAFRKSFSPRRWLSSASVLPSFWVSRSSCRIRFEITEPKRKQSSRRPQHLNRKLRSRAPRPVAFDCCPMHK